MASMFTILLRTAAPAVLAIGALAATPASAHYTTTRCDRDGDSCHTVRCDDDGDDCGRLRQPRYSYGYRNRYDNYYRNGYENPGLNFGLHFGSPNYGNGESREHEEEENEERHEHDW